MTSILCLAHYCDIHGPTPLITTEGDKVPCSTCYDGVTPMFMTNAPPNTNTTSNLDSLDPNPVILESSLHRLGFSTLNPQTCKSNEKFTRSALLCSSTATTFSSHDSTSPLGPVAPESPRRIDTSSRQDSGFRKTYDEHTTRRAGPCDNCALTVPASLNQQNGSPEIDETKGPVLRSTWPYNRSVIDWPRSTPPSSRESAASDSEADGLRSPSTTRKQRTSASRASMTSSSGRSPVTTGNEHMHYIKYISAKEPLRPESYTIVRASCIRTLSFETLPRSPTSYVGSVPGFVTTHSAGYAASGGPMFFGDQGSGYTTAYIFRISDVHARGHKRVYALLAISTHRERQVMQKFEYLARRFRHLAAHIQHLAEVEAEKASDASNSPIIGSGPFANPIVERDERDTTGSRRGGTSSFMAGGGGFNRRMGMGPTAGSLRARGLAELVGQPDFFYRVHLWFAQLLYEIDRNRR